LNASVASTDGHAAHNSKQTPSTSTAAPRPSDKSKAHSTSDITGDQTVRTGGTAVRAPWSRAKKTMLTIFELVLSLTPISDIKDFCDAETRMNYVLGSIGVMGLPVASRMIA
jgi:hypothetical protein